MVRHSIPVGHKEATALICSCPSHSGENCWYRDVKITDNWLSQRREKERKQKKKTSPFLPFSVSFCFYWHVSWGGEFVINAEDLSSPLATSAI
ncbi:hypothetical protein NXS19_010943 [Fusarium pseudograminearum]|nr:hypothetical protein NXS19_010943 [Fusarium pseudograminearum]